MLACASVVFYFPRQRPSRSEVSAFQAEVVDLIRSYYPSIWDAHPLIQGTQFVMYPFCLICLDFYLLDTFLPLTAGSTVPEEALDRDLSNEEARRLLQELGEVLLQNRHVFQLTRRDV